jgi:hypothetical protein
MRKRKLKFSPSDQVDNGKDSKSASLHISGLGSSPKKNRPKKIIFFCLFVTIILVGAFVTFSLTRNKDCTKEYTKICAITEARELLSNEDQDRLAPIVEKIKRVKGNQSDPNLLYILTVYYYNSEDNAQAVKYSDLLSQNYKDNIGYDSLLAEKSPLSPSELRELVDFQTQAQSANDLNNSNYKIVSPIPISEEQGQ